MKFDILLFFSAPDDNNNIASKSKYMYHASTIDS